MGCSRARSAPVARRKPPCDARLARRRSRARPAAQPSLRHSAGRVRRHAGSAAPPPDPHVRRARAEHHARRRDPPCHLDGSRAARHAASGRARRPRHTAGAVGPRRRERVSDADVNQFHTQPLPKVAAKAQQLRRLELLVTRRLDGLLRGEFLGLQPGPGTEPYGTRQYEAGDDARRIDWNLTARSLSPQLRTTEADRELSTWLVVDRSASMNFGTANSEKSEVAFASAAA